ncbi:dipeptide ABC transporter ATP-binding protein [Pseudanabaena sp. PCC 6802]|uniref:dipeptide ABC transporter ATP-binding protein n=1 Tax=Pseudanabaena sp. PCC 6802 TaxID=118173 RepID=UPI0003494802|nr:ABC transporter ATP-binding protein [Pseudanabaena sp. PCC 6802]
MLLEIKDLTVSYGAALPAVERVSLQLQAGESLGLVGESGCGKSTLGRSLIQLLPSHAQVSGQISVADTSVLELSAGQLRHLRGEKVALIFQDPMTRLNPLMTIEAHGLEVLRSHCPNLSKLQAKQRVHQALHAVRIDPKRARQYPHEFSGGMRQRVTIALALLLNPALLIADEPTTSLDVTVAAEILQELTQLRREKNMGLLLITHDLGLVARYCDRIAVMYDGAIVETGDALQVFRHPQHPYTQKLLRSVIHFKDPANRETESNRSGQNRSDRPLLKVSNLVKHYATGSNLLARWFDRADSLVRAIDGVSFNIYPGDIFGVIGESGSGKSTTGRAILQLVKPDRGSVEFDGVELTALKGEKLRRLRPQMQTIFQDPRACLNPRMTVLESVADPLLIHKLVPNLATAQEKVLSILERVGLPRQFASRLPQDLSGGQLQRVAIARALITNPRFLICDEPVSMLDATIQSQILHLMLEIKQEFNLTFMFITHDLGVAQSFCNRLAVMRQGKIVEQGTTESLLGNPQHAYTMALLNSIPRLPALEI